MDSFDITSLRRAWLITGNFGLKFSPNDFAILLVRSNHRPINEPLAPYSKSSKAKLRAALVLENHALT